MQGSTFDPVRTCLERALADTERTAANIKLVLKAVDALAALVDEEHVARPTQDSERAAAAVAGEQYRPRP